MKLAAIICAVFGHQFDEGTDLKVGMRDGYGHPVQGCCDRCDKAIHVGYLYGDELPLTNAAMIHAETAVEKFNGMSNRAITAEADNLRLKGLLRESENKNRNRRDELANINREMEKLHRDLSETASANEALSIQVAQLSFDSRLEAVKKIGGEIVMAPSQVPCQFCDGRVGGDIEFHAEDCPIVVDARAGGKL